MADIIIVSPEGEKEQEVSEKAFELIYEPAGYTRKPLKELTKEQKSKLVEQKVDETMNEIKGAKSRVVRNRIATAPEKQKLLNQNTARAADEKDEQ